MNKAETIPKFVTASYDNITIASDTLLPFSMEAVRIIPGVSIDGVLPGDDSLTVISKLGPPDLITPAGDLDGWAFYYLTPDNPHSYMAVIISRDTLYGIGVILVEVEAPYRGKTQDAIGIESHRDGALLALGNPFYTDSTSALIDFYGYTSPVPSFSFTQCLFWYNQSDLLLYRVQYWAFLTRSQKKPINFGEEILRQDARPNKSLKPTGPFVTRLAVWKSSQAARQPARRLSSVR